MVTRAPDTDGPGQPRDHFSSEEFLAAVDKISSDEKLRLLEIERRLRRGTNFGENELLHDAVCRTICGHRNWPRDVGLIPFLVMTMRSVASHERERQRTTINAATQQDIRSDQPDPEQQLIDKGTPDVLDTFLTLFADDEEVQLVLLGWNEGKRGKSLREATGLDQASLDYAIKRFRRKTRKLYPNGWTA